LRIPTHGDVDVPLLALAVTLISALSLGVGAITYAESAWTYDKLGRVESQTVKKGASLDQVVKQQLHYFGNDDPATLDHWLGTTNQKHFVYTYDLRHQLTNVGETILPNAFTATYAYGPNGGSWGRFSAANVNAASLPNGDVKVRNLNYIYSGSDPEQLTTLKTTSGNKTWASYTYDLAGNQLSRDYPSNPHPSNEHWDYVYDGKNQLRRVTKKVNNVVQSSEEYWYDYKNTRTLIVTRNAGGTKTGARWFIEDTEAEYDATGVVTRAYGHVSMGTPVFRVDRSADTASTVEYQFHGLANNTIAAIEQVTGTINASFNYAPFGELVEATNAVGNSGIASHRRRMNDKFVDDVSGLSYYGYRYYDKHSMIWTQSDPLYRFSPDASSTEPRGAALYAMTLNNPLRYLDPDGRMPGGEAIMQWGIQTGNQIGQNTGGAAGRALAFTVIAVVAVAAGAVYLKDSGPMRAAAGVTRGALGVLVAPAAMGPMLMGDKDRITPPSWVVGGGLMPAAGERAQEFAKRILDDKYGSGNWKKGPGSEFSSIVKWVNRTLGAAAVAKGAKEAQDGNESDQKDKEEQHFAPADADHDGKVSDDEESAHMRKE